MCLACNAPLLSADLDAFGGRILDILNHGATAVMLSLGYRSGLFEALGCFGRPASSHEIAAAADLQERYVREWLGAMVASGIVDVTPDGAAYTLPPVHAAMLTAHGEGDWMAHLAQYITIAASVEDRLLKCFREGGGVPYSAYPRFHEVMEADSSQSIVGPLFTHILPLVDGLAERLEAGVRVLDVGCGRARAILALAEQFPKSHFTGFDLSEEAIADAQRFAQSRGITNVTLEVRDLSDFHRTAPAEAFDVVFSFDAIHDQARPDHVLAGIRRALRPSGVYLMQDIGASSNVADNKDHPLGPLLYTVSCTHCMTVSLAQGGMGVGAMWGEQLTREFLADAGFHDVVRHTLAHDPQNYYYVCQC